MTRSIRKTAFTTIELLVVIGILVILAGMAFVGYKVVGTGGKTRSTKAALESARAMTAEIDAAGGMSGIKSIYPTPPSPITTPVYLYAFPPLSVAGTVPTPIPAPAGNISEDAANNNRYTAIAVVRTQNVMSRLTGSPANRTIISQIPGERLLKWHGSATPPSGGISFDTSTKQPNPVMLVDGWGNPIIYVPPSGLRGVYFKDETNNYTNENSSNERVITSYRVRRMYNSAVTTPASLTYGSFDPGATGFWASAGPDGDFTTGDDNVYSFE